MSLYRKNKVFVKDSDRIMKGVRNLIHDELFDYMDLNWDNLDLMKITNNEDGTYRIILLQYVDYDTYFTNKEYRSLSEKELNLLLSDFRSFITSLYVRYLDDRKPIYVEIDQIV